jgi:DNA-binding transcriptional ArsR family regulator
MKFDKEIMREILLEIERSDQDPRLTVDLSSIKQSPILVAYHIQLMYEAGIIEAVDQSSMSQYAWQAQRLTYQGHELLDAIRDPDIWNKTKAAAQKVGGAGLNFIWELAKMELRSRLGLV